MKTRHKMKNKRKGSPPITMAFWSVSRELGRQFVPCRDFSWVFRVCFRYNAFDKVEIVTTREIILNAKAAGAQHFWRKADESS